MDLPHEVLVTVLQQVPQRQRLTSCALVARRWPAAAAAATPIIVLQPSDEAALEGAQAYLAKHGQHLTHLHFAVACISGRGPFPPLNQLPCPQLRSLEVHGATGFRVRLGPEGGQPGMLQACTQLTRPTLWTCPQPQPAAVIATGLSTLTGLQHLSLWAEEGSSVGGWPRPPEVPPSLLAALSLAQLQLTHLALHQFTASDAGLQPLSRLTSLQQLHLELLVSSHVEWTPDALFCGLAHLPHFTALEMPAGGPGPISATTTPGFGRLTGLQQLDLLGCPGLQPAVLAVLTQLRRLDLTDTFMEDQANVSALLAWLAQATHVRHLDLPNSMCMPAAPAAYAALTASSQLERLDLYKCPLPPGVWPHMFPQGRRLPQLRRLNVSYASGIIQPHCLMGPSDVVRLVQCCPGLQALHAELQLATPLAALQQLQRVTSLGISGVTDETAQHLAQLTGLSSLLVYNGSNIGRKAGCMELIALTRLTSLRAVVAGHGPGYLRINNMAPQGAASDVWQQLAQWCAAG